MEMAEMRVTDRTGKPTRRRPLPPAAAPRCGRMGSEVQVLSSL
jgi:hypothetical protein